MADKIKELFAEFRNLGPSYAATSSFSVNRIDRRTLRYTEGARVLDVEVEPGDGLAIYTSTIQSWLPPYHTDDISPEKRQQIIERIRAALLFLNMPCVVK